VGLNKLEQPAILFGRPVASASRSTGHFPSTRFDKTEVTPFAHCWPSSCRPECWRFRKSADRELLFYPDLFLRLQLIDAHKRIRSAIFVFDESEAAVCVPHFQFARGHSIFPF
jgi:hypothetical protein